MQAWAASAGLSDLGLFKTQALVPALSSAEVLLRPADVVVVRHVPEYLVVKQLVVLHKEDSLRIHYWSVQHYSIGTECNKQIIVR